MENRQRSRRWRARGAAMSMAALASFALPTVAFAAPDQSVPAGAGHGSPERPCTRQPSAHGSARNEFASCLTVAATVDRAPSRGEPTLLRVDVEAQHEEPAVVVDVDLPVQVSSSGGAGLAAGPALGGGGGTHLRGRTGVGAGGRAHLDVPITGSSDGFGAIHVTATRTSADGATVRGFDDVFLRVGDTPSTSSLADGPVPTGPAPRRAADPSADPSEPAAPAAGGGGGRTPNPPAAAPAPSTDDASAPAGTQSIQATSCATGGWFYQDRNGVKRGASDYYVEVWDKDTSTADDLLATGFTTAGGSGDGRFNICFGGGDGEGGGQEVYLKFISANGGWRVRNTAGANNDYVDTTGVINACDGCTAAFGDLFPGDAAYDGALAAYDAVDMLYRFIPLSSTGGCWDANDTPGNDCRQLVVNWTPTSTDGTYYDTGTGDVHLAGVDPKYPHVVIHEATHALMDDVYEDNFPSAPNCNPHYIYSTSSTGCAWTEGFAEWLPVMVLNDPLWAQPTFSVNMETTTWGTDAGYSLGDGAEGRVAGAMIDLSDSTQDGPWDTGNEGFLPQYQTFLNQRSATFQEFLITDRGTMGNEVLLDGAARAAAYQNTIDYSFRNRLNDGVQLVRPSLDVAPNPHNDTITETATAWSAVAVRPPATADYDVKLFDQATLTGLLAATSGGTGRIDYVAIDSNHRAKGADYPQVSRAAGSGSYTVEWAQGSSLGDGTFPVTMSATDVVRVFNTALVAGTTTFFRVVPGNGTQDPELLLHDSDPATASTWTQGRQSALRSSIAAGQGLPESFSLNPFVGDTMGLVLANKAGSGTYTLYRDTTAPTGSISIAGGAAVARSTSVSLTLTASDLQTGVSKVRISTDGTLDTEAFVAMSPSTSITLPSGDGTKTVLAQFQNNAGMSSSIVADTITLDTRPDLVALSATNPPATGPRGSTFSMGTSVTNTSGSTAPASTTRFLLSTDTVRSSTDRLLTGTMAVGALGVGATATATTTLTIPSTINIGTYHVLACADDLLAVNELDETNNCVASAGTVAVQVADLQVSRLDPPPAGGAAGASFSTTVDTKNIGTLAANASTTRLYLSADGVFNAGDRAVGDVAVPTLAPLAVSESVPTVTIPGDVAAGTYSLIACADAGGVVPENYEYLNNCRTASGTITITSP